MIEVGYSLSSCKSRTTGKQSNCLWRRSSTTVDNDVSRGGTTIPMVENVTKFELQYLSEDFADKEWKKEWMSDQNGTGATRNKFPAMVKIVLEIHDENSKTIGKFNQTIIANVRFPNNTDPATFFSGQPQVPAGGANGSTDTP